MAYINNTRFDAIFAERPGIVARFIEWRARRAVFNRTFKELDSLSERELADLGIHRSEIGKLAREAARKI